MAIGDCPEGGQHVTGHHWTPEVRACLSHEEHHELCRGITSRSADDETGSVSNTLLDMTPDTAGVSGKPKAEIGQLRLFTCQRQQREGIL
jgi:hypothetical protein